MSTDSNVPPPPESPVNGSDPEYSDKDLSYSETSITYSYKDSVPVTLAENGANAADEEASEDDEPTVIDLWEFERMDPLPPWEDSASWEERQEAVVGGEESIDPDELSTGSSPSSHL